MAIDCKEKIICNKICEIMDLVLFVWHISKIHIKLFFLIVFLLLEMCP